MYNENKKYTLFMRILKILPSLKYILKISFLFPNLTSFQGNIARPRIESTLFEKTRYVSLATIYSEHDNKDNLLKTRQICELRLGNVLIIFLKIDDSKPEYSY